MRGRVRGDPGVVKTPNAAVAKSFAWLARSSKGSGDCSRAICRLPAQGHRPIVCGRIASLSLLQFELWSPSLLRSCHILSFFNCSSCSSCVRERRRTGASHSPHAISIEICCEILVCAVCRPASLMPQREGGEKKLRTEMSSWRTSPFGVDFAKRTDSKESRLRL